MFWSIHLDAARTSACSMFPMLAWQVGSLSLVVALSWYLFWFAGCEGISTTERAAETGNKWDFPKWSWQVLQPGPSPLCVSVTVYRTDFTRHPYQQIHRAIAADMVYTILFCCCGWIGLITFHKG